MNNHSFDHEDRVFDNLIRQEELASIRYGLSNSMHDKLPSGMHLAPKNAKTLRLGLSRSTVCPSLSKPDCLGIRYQVTYIPIFTRLFP